MPYLPPLSRTGTHHPQDPAHRSNERSQDPHVHITSEAEDMVAHLHRTVSEKSGVSDKVDPAFADFENYIRDQHHPLAVSVCFKNLTTYGRASGFREVKTLKHAIWRTLTFQDLYEWTIKPYFTQARIENARPLLHDFSGVIRSGQITLVLGNPGSGCSTFLRTIANDHSAFLKVDGFLDYSGLTPEGMAKSFRGALAYVPEDDVHLPTLTVRQTLDFALRNRTPKRLLHEIPRFIEQYGRIFGMTHVLDTLVGNEYIRGISGGERKRVTILESLASNSSVNAWDGATRGLDASSALDYVRSLRIMTDACHRATVVALYQASDAIYDLVDNVILIDEGRMLFQGPARDAEPYFNSLGYERQERQTMSSFLTRIASSAIENIRPGFELCVPRTAVNLEKAFRSSQAFKEVEMEIRLYEAEQNGQPTGSEHSETLSIGSGSNKVAIEQASKAQKSKYVSRNSSYTISLVQQVRLCIKREFWQLSGHLAPFMIRLACILVSAFLIGSMFYMMPDDTQGVYSRGGLSFYSAVLVAWFQLAELENAFADREVVSRHKKLAMVRPSAVVVAKTVVDIPLVLLESTFYSLVAYFLSGMRLEPGPFFLFELSVFLCAMAFTAFFRVFAAASPRLEVALRYCGVLLVLAMVVGGYVRSVDQLMAEVPWVGWLAFLTPVLYAYENIMAVEFQGRTFNCAPGSVIPSGPGYEDVAFQVCSYIGVAPGALDLDGDIYLQEKFGFAYSNVGRNFGILIAFLVGLVLINMLLVEKKDWAEVGGSLEFTRMSKTLQRKNSADLESSATSSDKGHFIDSSPALVEGQLQNNLEKSQSTFVWRHLEYSVAHRGSNKTLLNDISGFSKPGTMTALVGSSGAGKSTLMSVLTQQANGMLKSGEIKVNGNDINPSLGRDIGYCQQMDIHVETSTVREAFEFSALLRQDSKTSKQEKLAYANTVLDILGMTELQHAVIKSLSLEQKKRTTIGVELCAKPGLVLFLDEPTSGLDNQGALNIVKLLRRLTDAGQMIICTIHQASQEEFELFDRALAIGQGGRVYYFGDIGSRGHTILDYFCKHGIEADSGKNVADLLIEVAAQKYNASAKVQDWSQIWADSSEAKAVLGEIDLLISEGQAVQESNEHPTPVLYASSTMQQIYHLTNRTLLQYWRTPEYIYSRLFCSVVHAALNGLTFLQLGNTISSIQYRVFSFFLVLMIVPEFINASSMMFVDNRNIWLSREGPSRIYGWFAFATAQIAAEIPAALLGGVIFYVIFYFLVGFPLGTPAAYSFIMMMLFHLFGTSWGQWIAALSTDAVMAASVMPFFLVVCEFFNGVLQPKELMPAVWRYTFYYIGPFMYWINGLVATSLDGLPIQCADSELLTFQPPPGDTCGNYAASWLNSTTGYLVNLDAQSECGYCQYSMGQDYLSTLSVSVSDAWLYLGIFALFTFTNYVSVYIWVYIKSVKVWLPW